MKTDRETKHLQTPTLKYAPSFTDLCGQRLSKPELTPSNITTFPNVGTQLMTWKRVKTNLSVWKSSAYDQWIRHSWEWKQNPVALPSRISMWLHGNYPREDEIIRQVTKRSQITNYESRTAVHPPFGYYFHARSGNARFFSWPLSASLSHTIKDCNPCWFGSLYVTSWMWNCCKIRHS